MGNESFPSGRQAGGRTLRGAVANFRLLRGKEASTQILKERAGPERRWVGNVLSSWCLGQRREPHRK